MVRRAIISALWGDEQVDFWRGAKGDVLKEKRRLERGGPVVADRHVFAFGRENYDFLKQHEIDKLPGIIDLTLLTEEGIVDWSNGTAGARDPDLRGQVNWGLSYWQHKDQAILAAMETYGEVIWMDWDCAALKPVPGNLWKLLRQGPEVRCSLIGYKRFKAPWRQDDYSRRLVPHGAFMFFRSKWIVEETARVQRELYPKYIDETSLAYVIDQHYFNGRWQGVEAWEQAGFEIPIYGTKRLIIKRPVDSCVFWENRKGKRPVAA